MDTAPINRRQWLRTVPAWPGPPPCWPAAAVARRRGSGGGGRGPGPGGPQAVGSGCAHLTDVHVEPERAAGRGMAACLDHVQRPARPARAHPLRRRLRLRLHGTTTRPAPSLQWDLWQRDAGRATARSRPRSASATTTSAAGAKDARPSTTGHRAAVRQAERHATELGLAMHLPQLRPGRLALRRPGQHPPRRPHVPRPASTSPRCAWLAADLAGVDPRAPDAGAHARPHLLRHAHGRRPRRRTAPDAAGVPGTTVSGGSMHEDFRPLRAAVPAAHPNVRAVR